MLQLLSQLVLLFIGGTIFLSTFIIGIFYTFIKHIIKLNYSFSKQLAPIIRNINLALDGLANAGGGEMINDILKVKGIIRYGKWYQTISAVTGLRYFYVKDTKFRKVLDKILGKNHCVNAITNEDNLYYKLIN